MRFYVKAFLVISLVLCIPLYEAFSQRGGRGGGGRGGGGARGGGGGFRGGAPRGGYSGAGRPAQVNRGRPAQMPNRSPAMSRPNVPNRSLPAQRPGGVGGGGRPSTLPGNRPNIGAGGNRPGQLPSGGNRPGIAGGNRPGQLPSGGNRPGQLPSGGNRPGIAGGGNRPGTLPGGGAGAGLRPGDRPGAGTGNRFSNALPGLAGGLAGGMAADRMSNWRDRMGERPNTAEGRRDNLQDRMAGRDDRQGNRQDRRDDRQDNRGDRQDNRGDRRDDRQDNRGDRQDNRQDARTDRQENRQDARSDRQENRQDWANNNREDWQNWADERYPHHGDWYNGCWNGHWGEGWWNHMWSEHPIAAAYGLTWWGVNRACWWSGYWPYENPYAYDLPVNVYNYSTPLVEYQAAPVVVEGAPATAIAADTLPPGVTTEGMNTFDAARDAFKQGKYDQALDLVNQVIKQMPNDAHVHEFRALVLFALGNYKEAAAALYSVLSVGPGMNWTTMSSLYGSTSDYEKQLRAAEDYATKNPKAPDGHFLLAYHYLSCGHNAQAADQLRLVREVYPDDRLTNNLLTMVSPAKDAPAQPAAGAAPKPTQEPAKIDPAKLTGAWKASGGKGTRFELVMTADGKFTWAYTRGQKREEVKGVFAVEQGVLALEPNGSGDSGAMLADVTFGADGKMKFQMIGGPKGDPGLEFVKDKS